MDSKWNPQSSGNCSNCNFFPGDVTHYLSGSCPSLSAQLKLTLDRSLTILASTPLLLQPVLFALNSHPDEWAAFVVDPFVNSQVIAIRQTFGSEAVWPLFRLSRAYIWCMDRERKRLMK